MAFDEFVARMIFLIDLLIPGFERLANAVFDRSRESRSEKF
jgi:hypothetical protein